MSARAAYLDTSAFVKLIVAEPESEALRERLKRWPERASATLLRTETVRALRRRPRTRTVAVAGRGSPRGRPVHRLGPRVLFSCYDERLMAAANEHGLQVESPH